MHVLYLALCILGGFILARTTGLFNLEDASWYNLVVATLLAIGLYASTYGIDLKEARQHIKIILSAVTIGVVLKAVIIGGSLALIFKDPFFLILGVAVAQIDPLSVAALLKGDRMSSRAKTILASWASFDDPVTVILSLYTPLIVMQITGAEVGPITGNADVGFLSYVQEFGFNLGLAALAFGAHKIVSRYAHKYAFGAGVASYVLLALVFSISIFYFMMLGIALVGLFLRPPKLEKVLDGAITWALRLAAVLLGVVLIDGVSIAPGIALGVAAYVAQIMVGALLTRGLPRKDRWHIAFAQQNGITAIILALLFEPVHPGTVAIVAPAIIVIKVLHYTMNKAVDKWVV